MAKFTPARERRAPKIEPVEPKPHVIQLADYAEWDSWAEANAEAIIAEYGSLEHALQHAVDGGLVLGGGAAPEFLVCFEDRP